MNSARLVAWVGFVFGSLVSIGGNILAVWVPPKGAGPDWSPTLASQFGAGVWPVALLIAVEVLSRTAWPLLTHAAWWQKLITRLLTYGAVCGVALFAATISYQHIRDVLLFWNYPGLSAGVGPLVIDGLMVISGYAMVVGSTAVVAMRDVEQSRATEPLPKIAKNITVPKTAFEPPQPDLAQVVGEQNQRAENDWDSRQMQDSLLGPVPTQRNGHRVSAALKTGPKAPARRKSGQSDEEIVAVLRAEIERGENPDLTKRGVMQRFSVGAPRWNKITELLKKEES
jgi:hypothetical protein